MSTCFDANRNGAVNVNHTNLWLGALCTNICRHLLTVFTEDVIEKHGSCLHQNLVTVIYKNVEITPE